MDEFIPQQGTFERQGYVIPILEIAFVVICVLAVEWAVLPIFGKNAIAGLIPVIVAFSAIVTSHLVRHETPWEIGWRLDNLGESARVLLPPMLFATVFLIFTGLALGSLRLSEIRPTGPVLSTLSWLFVWGLMQQYALQGFVNRRAQIIWGKGLRSVALVAVIFAFLHLPNPWLTLATFVSGLMWAWAYQRSPNLLALALSHVIMTVVLVLTLPYSALHGLKVGYGYFLQ